MKLEVTKQLANSSLDHFNTNHPISDKSIPIVQTIRHTSYSAFMY